jgi:hypothetical protein
MSAELWLPVVGFEDAYEVSDFGHVRRTRPAQGTRPGQVLKPIINADGYWNYNIQSNGKRLKLRAHRLVLDAFVGPQPEMFGLHSDDNPANNHLDNLRWGTRLDNAADWKRNGIRVFPNQHALKTHCQKGHEFSEENTRVRSGSKGQKQRVCRTCAKQWRTASTRT